MRPPSEQGAAEARRHVAAYSRELLDEASRIATRRGADEASTDHVAEAAAHLYASGASRLNTALSTGGGVTLGAASSALVTFLLTEPVNQLGVGVATTVTVLGAIATTAGTLRRA